MFPLFYCTVKGGLGGARLLTLTLKKNRRKIMPPSSSNSSLWIFRPQFKHLHYSLLLLYCSNSLQKENAFDAIVRSVGKYPSLLVYSLKRLEFGIHCKYLLYIQCILPQVQNTFPVSLISCAIRELDFGAWKALSKTQQEKNAYRFFRHEISIKKKKVTFPM